MDLLSRSSYYLAKEENDEFIFNIIDIKEKDEIFFNDDTDMDEERYKIQIFGITKNSKSVCLEITDFPPFFYIKLPHKLTKVQQQILISEINKKIGNGSYRIVEKDCVQVEKKELIGFKNGEKDWFLRLTFKNLVGLHKCKYKFNYPMMIPMITKRPYKFEIYESNIPPMLRFLHYRNILPCGWLKVNKCEKYSENYYYTSFKNIKSINCDDIAPYMCCAFDIECMSEYGGFPKPQNPNDVVFMVCTTFRRNPDNNSLLKVIHTLKPCNNFEDENIKIITCNSEKELLLSWRDLINSMNPDIIYGYNSSGFDFTYMYERARKNGIATRFLRMSKNKSEPSEWKEMRLSSSALGDNLLKFIDMKGRIIMDVMKEIQKEQIKLDMYKLDYVLKYYLNDSKVDLKPKELFEKYKNGNKKDLKDIAIYCLKDADACHDLVWKLNIILKAIKMANVCLVPLHFIFMRGQGIKIFSLFAKECKKKGYLIPLIRKENANYISDKQKRVKLESEIKAREKYDGAIVIEPKVGLYYTPVVVNDYNSLYPNCQRAWNISHDTIILNEKYLNIEGLNYETIEYFEYDINGNMKKDPRKCTYVQVGPNGENSGIVPNLTEKLLRTRKEVKNLMKSEKDLFKKTLLDCEQLAYKVVANSIYGQTGAPVSPIYYKHIAACTTSKGREMLNLAKDVAEAKFPEVRCIYGDTDSNFYEYKIDVENKSNEEIVLETMKMGELISEEVNKAIGKPNIMNFAYEKVAYPLLLVKKKGYYFRKYEDDPKKYKEVAMGLATIRRNYCSFSKKIYQELLTKLMESASPDPVAIISFIKNQLNRLIENEVPLNELTITKNLKENYKNPDSQAHYVLSQKMRERGEIVNSNDRIAYIFAMKKPNYNTRGNPVKVNDSEIVEELNYAREHDVIPDPEKYIMGQIQEPVGQILEFITNDTKSVFEEAIIKCRQKKIEVYGPPVIPSRKKK